MDQWWRESASIARIFLRLGGVVLRTRFCVAPASSSPSTATEILMRIPCVSSLCGRSDASPDFFDSSDHFDASISTLAPCLHWPAGTPISRFYEHQPNRWGMTSAGTPVYDLFTGLECPPVPKKDVRFSCAQTTRWGVTTTVTPLCFLNDPHLQIRSGDLGRSGGVIHEKSTREKPQHC